MDLYPQLSEVHLGRTWLTIGTFDGVHLGHQALISRLVAGAHAAGALAAVLTFHPHPAVVLRGIDEPFYLTSPEEKYGLLSGLGVDACLAVEFTLELAAMTAPQFMEMLLQRVALERLLVGQGFALGRGRTGDTIMLERIGAEQGFTLEVVPLANPAGVPASSSTVRSLLRERDVAGAARLLGRPYSLRGIVGHGDGRGGKLGFPTANIATSRLRLLPGSGVYTCRVDLDGRMFPAVANIGVRPTFQEADHTLQLEVHLLDFAGDLYGKLLRVEFQRFVRQELKFESAESLAAQLRRDVQAAREGGNA